MRAGPGTNVSQCISFSRYAADEDVVMMRALPFVEDSARAKRAGSRSLVNRCVPDVMGVSNM